jgi:hypothetical protein
MEVHAERQEEQTDPARMRSGISRRAKISSNTSCGISGEFLTTTSVSISGEFL